MYISPLDAFVGGFWAVNAKTDSEVDVVDIEAPCPDVAFAVKLPAKVIELVVTSRLSEPNRKSPELVVIFRSPLVVDKVIPVPAVVLKADPAPVFIVTLLPESMDVAPPAVKLIAPTESMFNTLPAERATLEVATRSRLPEFAAILKAEPAPIFKRLSLTSDKYPSESMARSVLHDISLPLLIVIISLPFIC
jgi:hypothetical protein